MGRYAYQSVLDAPGVIATPSAAQAGFPLRRLLDSMPSLEWRTPVGWTIGANNDRLDFERSSVPYAAVLDHGTYATPAEIADHVEARMNAEDANSYNIVPNTTSGQSKFPITGSATFELRFGTGANKERSIALDLGHSEVDKTGADNYASNTDAYHSRAWVVFDLLAAVSIASAFLDAHNLSAGGVARLQGNATDAWTAPSLDQVLAVAGDKRLAYFAAVAHRYLRLVVDDRANDDAFTSIGILRAGPYLEPARAQSYGEPQGRIGPTELVRAVQGAGYQVRRQQGGRWSILQETLDEAERDAFAALGDEVRLGGVLMWTRSLADLADTHYVRLLNHVTPERRPDAPDYWRLALELEEVLG